MSRSCTSGGGAPSPCSERGKAESRPSLWRASRLYLLLLASVAVILTVAMPFLPGRARSESDPRTRGLGLIEGMSCLDRVQGPPAKVRPLEESRCAGAPVSTRANDSLADAARHRLEEALGKAAPGERQTAALLKRFAASGAMEDLRRVEREAVVALAEHLAQELTPSEAGALLHEFLGLSPGSLSSRDEVGATLVGIYDALAGHGASLVRPSVLTITDAAAPDGRITGQMHVLPGGTERVYAVFENDFALKGLEQVMAVWRNPEDDRLVFTEFEPIRQGSAYNYVWLEVADGWPAGRYQVELFHPGAQSLLLASESFSVR